MSIGYNQQKERRFKKVRLECSTAKQQGGQEIREVVRGEAGTDPPGEPARARGWHHPKQDLRTSTAVTPLPAMATRKHGPPVREL